MIYKQKISSDDLKSPLEKNDSDIDHKKKDKPGKSKDDSKSPLKKKDSDIDDKNNDKPGTSKDDSKSPLEKKDSDIDDKKKDKPGTSKDDSEKNDSDFNDMKALFKEPVEEPVEETDKSEVMFEPLLEPSKESSSKDLPKSDDKDSVNDIKEQHEISKDVSPREMQDKTDISENTVDEKEVTQTMSHSDSDILKINNTNKTQTSEIHSKPSSHTSKTQESPETFERTRQENSKNGKKEDKSFDSIKISLQDSSSEERSEGEDKKSVSIEEDAEEKHVGHKQSRWKAEARPSSLRRQFTALEKELTLDKINKRVSSVFTPDILKGVSDDTSRGSEDVSDDKVVEEPKTSHLSPTMASIFIISIATGYSITSLPFYLRKSSECFL